jgi:WD40 repeat protein
VSDEKRAWAVLRADGASAVTLGAQGALQFWEVTDQPRLVTSTRVEAPRDLALLERRNAVAVATSHAIELFSLPDGRSLERVDFSQEPLAIGALAFSIDGASAAIAGFGEQIRLLSVDGWREHARVEGGEWMSSLAFDASGELLASACSFQNGAMVRIDRIVKDALAPVREIGRADHQTPDQSFVDCISSVAWAPDGSTVGLFETSAVGGLHDEPGWRGNIALYDALSGACRWERSIGAALGNDRRTLEECGYPGGYPARITFDVSGNLVFGSTMGSVAVLDQRTGERIRTCTLDRSLDLLATLAGRDGRLWAVAPDAILRQIK